MKWCIECGAAGSPTEAVRTVDGDPLCAMHAQIRQPGAAEKPQQPAARVTIETTVQKPAPQHAPRNPNPPATEDTMRICKGYKQPCSNELNERNETGLCKTCYARKNYHDRKDAKTSAPARRALKEATPVAIQIIQEGHEDLVNAIWAALPIERRRTALRAILVDVLG